jgi:hypothetical protein
VRQLQLAFGKNDKFINKKAFNDAKYKPKQYFSGPQPITLEQKYCFSRIRI